MALKIVRATDDERVSNPLRLWYASQHDEALAALRSSAGGRWADEAPKLCELALAADVGHAVALGEAVVLWDDDVAGYRVLKQLVEALIDGIGALGPQRWSPHGVALVHLLRPWLDRHPAEPVFLNYLGVGLYGLNEPTLALKVLQAAQRLDGDLENVVGNIAAAKERARKPVRLVLAARERGAIDRLRPWLKALPPRATAAPATDGIRISLCMIVRDEEEMLPDCLASCCDGVDEMIVVDTGSTDRTVEIAESYGATILSFPWSGSFSDARNHGLDAATGTHILWLDADERLEDGDADGLRALAAQRWREAHWLVETNFTGQEEVGTAANHLALRLWRNRPPYRFSGAIHEQIRVSMPIDLPERFAISSLRIRHYGYLKSRIEERNKHERNLELLETELKRNPSSAFTHFNLGTEYVAMDEMARAGEHLEEAYRLIQREAGWYEIAYASLLATRLIGVRRRLGAVAAADALASELLAVYPTFTDLVFERALCARERGDLDGADALFARCLEMGDAPARFAGMVGRGSFLALAARATVAAERGDDPTAIALLEESLTRFPAYLPAGLELTDRLLASGADPDAVLTRLQLVGNEQATWWLFLGTAFYERGHAEIAESLFRRALARTGTQAAASVGLAEALLTQHRYGDVVAEAADLPVGTAPFLAMQRIVALAAVLADQPAAAIQAIDALVQGGGDEAEASFLRAFAGVDTRPGTAAAPYGFRILDALARLEEFDEFERTVPIAVGAVGDPRLAALTLAELLLARGFYRVAAESAMRALDLGGPESRALATLGKAAVAEGLFEDALPILEASLELDPTQPALETLLIQLRQRAVA